MTGFFFNYFFFFYLHRIVMDDVLQKALSSERASAFGFPCSPTDARRVRQLRRLTHSQLHVVVRSHLRLRKKKKKKNLLF